MPYLSNFLKFVTACGALTTELEITIELSQQLSNASYPQVRA